MIDHESDRRLSEMLDELGPADPPADFTRNVIGRIRNNHVTIHRSHSLSNRKGTAMTRKAMWGLAAAAAILLAIFVVRGFPPAGEGTESTIGAAQRYQAPQIADSDVVLGDAAVQEFIQSDTFERAINDPDVRALLADARIGAALQDQELVNALRQGDNRAALMNADLHRLFSNEVARRALQSREFMSVFAAEAKKAMAALEAADARGAVMRTARANLADTQAARWKASEAALQAAVATAATKKMADDASLMALLRDSSAAAALADARVVRALENNAIQKVLANDALRTRFAEQNVAAALSRQAFLDAVNHEAFASAVGSRSIQNRLSAAQ